MSVELHLISGVHTDSALMGATPFCLSLGAGVEFVSEARSSFKRFGLDPWAISGAPCLSYFSALVTAESSGATSFCG